MVPPIGTGHARPERTARLRSGLDLACGVGLEIGPLYAPVVLKSEANVVYVDIKDAEGLREYYLTHPGTPVEDIVEVDYALIRGDRSLSLKEATSPSQPFHWAIASHVIEHVPDVIGWLRDVASVLIDGGKLSLAIPDRRFGFDAGRPPTTVGEMLEAHHQRYDQPSVRAVFDHYYGVTKTEAATMWGSGRPPDRDERIFDLDMAHQMYRRALAGEYMDCHVWLFTPRSFVRQLEILIHLGLCDFVVADIHPTARNDLEFFVTLERLGRELDLPGVERATVNGFRLPERDFAVSGTRSEKLVLSEREVRLIELKRRIMGRLRRA